MGSSPHSLGSPSSQGRSDIQSVTAPSSACSWSWGLVTDPLWEEHRCQGAWRQCPQPSLSPSPLRACPRLCSCVGKAASGRSRVLYLMITEGFGKGAGKERPTVVPSPQKCPLPQKVRGGGHKFCVFPFGSLKKGGGWGGFLGGVCHFARMGGRAPPVGRTCHNRTPPYLKNDARI